MSDKIRVSYLIITQQDPEQVAREIALEQTVELPADLIPDSPDFNISESIVGQVTEIHDQDKFKYKVSIDYSVDLVSGSCAQLLNLIYGNISLKRGIKLIDLVLPDCLLAKFSGPGFGIDGVRKMLGVYHRPLLCAALKPLGLSPQKLAQIAYRFTLAGVDIVKDDHSLGDQVFCTYKDRVRLCQDAILEAGEKIGKKPLYLANINNCPEIMARQIDYALSLRIDGLLFQPTVIGLDLFHAVARNKDFLLMAHPSVSGVYFPDSGEEGISPGILLGTIFRLAGADAVIFPHYQGRFSFNELTCAEISHKLVVNLGSIAPSFPTPAGGININTLPGLRHFYSRDTIFLIGADLYRAGEGINDKIREFLDIF